MDTIGNRIKIWRKYLKLSQQKFADVIGMPLSTLKGYELNTRSPGSEALALFDRSGVNINWLVTGEGDMVENNLAQQKSLPDDLDPLQERFNHLFELILKIDEDKREAAIDEMLAHVRESARINELERLVKELRKEP